MRTLKVIAGMLAAGAAGAVGAAEIELPPCGCLVGHAVYNYQGLYPGGYGNWLVQRGSPFDLIERTVKEEQGNIIQFWFFNGSRPLQKAAWLDMEELGFKCPEPDWKNVKNLSCKEFPELAKHEKDRAGAGVLRAIRMCETNGLYSQLMYVGGVDEKYTKHFTDYGHYVGYDFGERFSFRSENGGNETQEPRLDRLADNLVASVRRHCADCRAKGYGNIWCTSSNFFMDYEVYGGVDYTLFEDFTCDLNVPSALSRGLARQYGLKLWGSHVANEYYAWISSKNPHFYRMLYSAFVCKYIAGAKVMISESGGWHTQTPGSDSPLNDLPKSRDSFTAKTPTDAELAPTALKAQALRDLASEEGHWSRSFREALGDFYRYVKRHGTPEGQPESTFALAKGNLDLEGGWLDARPKANSVVAGMHPYAERHMEWMAGAPEFGWGIANEVFWPRGQGIYGSKDVNRIFSGTPWGQVDIVSFAYDNVTAEHLLKNYRTIAFVGWNTCSEKQYGILCDYVKGGGRLLIAIPQLSKDVTRNYQAYSKDDLVNGGDFTELCGLKVVDRGPYFYWTGAVKGTSAEKWSSASTHGAYRGILGKVEVTNPKAEPLIYNWENDMNVLYRLPSGKGEVWFLNSWYYPGAYGHSYGTGVGPNSLGFVEDILREMARRSRGTAYLTERGGEDPGEECKFVNWSYFPSEKKVILFNVDFEKVHKVDLHCGGKTIPLDLKPQEIHVEGASTAGTSACEHDYPFQAAALTQVKATGGFWFDRIETNRTATLRSNLAKCNETPRIANFTNAANRAWGTYGGIFFDDSDVFKVMEGAAYLVAQHPDAELEKYVDWFIGQAARAQQPDGYLYNARTLGAEKIRPTARWEGLSWTHELYNQGHMIEAAVAWYEATGKTNFLDVAVKSADLMCRTFGWEPTQLKLTSGHEEIELALCKLYRTTGQRKYLDLAKFFLDMRGRKDLRKTWGAGSQDHLPVIEQDEAIGHAVRAGYLYTGMADVAALTGDKSYERAVLRLWSDVVARKLYLTGGIGARKSFKHPKWGLLWEAFNGPYDLPNDSGEAYLETCAAIANILWNQRMFLTYGETKYVDVMELGLYNGFVSGISLSGDEYFYPNPLASKGGYRRSKWFGCSCCPVNDVRVIPQVPSFAYATDGKGTLYWNLFMQSEATVGGWKVKVETDYPWSGKAKLTVLSASDIPNSGMQTLKLRIPGWAVGKVVPSDLYVQTTPSSFMEVLVEVNGLALNGCPGEDGYVSIGRSWKVGDTVTVDLPTPVRRVKAHPSVKQDVGRLAVMRGPVLYCAEGVDNGGKAYAAKLPADATFADARISIGDKTYPALKASNGLVLIPYCLWDNREPGNEMQVWFGE